MKRTVVPNTVARALGLTAPDAYESSRVISDHEWPAGEPSSPASDRCSKCKRWFRTNDRPPPGEFALCVQCAEVIDAQPLAPRVLSTDWFLVDPKAEYRTATTISLDGFRAAIGAYKVRRNLTLVGVAACGCSVTHGPDGWAITDACDAHNRVWIVTTPRKTNGMVVHSARLAGAPQVAFDVLVGCFYDDAIDAYRMHRIALPNATLGLRSLSVCGCIADRHASGRDYRSYGPPGQVGTPEPTIKELETWSTVKSCTTGHAPLATVRKVMSPCRTGDL